MELPEIFSRLIQRQDLPDDAMESVMDRLMTGNLTQAQTGALLMGLRCKGETAAEIAAAARVMRRHATPVPVGPELVVDTCGTGGDGAGTFNISTTAAFIAAGAGIRIAKHGNRAASSRSGSADVLHELGVNITVSADRVGRCVREVGIGFLFAPSLHGAMRHVGGPRRELGVRTMFNLLGPLTNPAGAQAQIIGVYAPELTDLLANVLRNLGTRHAMVVHGHDGLDEISTTALTRIAEVKDNQITVRELDPRRWFGSFASAADLTGGDPVANAAITRAILAGQPGPCADIAILNAAAAIVVAGLAPDLDAAVPLARLSVTSGAAAARLAALAALSHSPS